MEEKSKGLLEPEGLDESKETVSSRYKYEPVEIVEAWADPAQSQTRRVFIAESRK